MRTTLPSAPSLRRRSAFAGLLLVVAAAQADPGADVAGSATDMTLAAVRRDARALTLVPEVSAVHPPPALHGAPVVGPDGRVMNELRGVQLRLWMSRGRTAVGLGVGTLGYVQPAPEVREARPAALVGATPTLSVGMRYRMSGDSAVFADASGARALPPDSGGYVNTGVGMEWKPATSRFGIDSGALGMRFDSGYRLSLKARKDGLRIYLRGQF